MSVCLVFSIRLLVFPRWLEEFKAVGCEPIVAQDLGLTDFGGWFRPAAAPVSLLSFVCRGAVRGDLILLVLVV